MSADRVLPRATYRVQLGPQLQFGQVGRLARYLADLGVSHVYLSPCLQAAPGSTHGYDVVDHSQASAELGGSAGFEAMCRALDEHGLGVVVDLVPNHMSIATPRLNPWWWDVLENGPSSLYSHYFDVDWHHPDERITNRILVPILGDHYGRVLASGSIEVARAGSALVIRAYEHEFPVAPISLAGPLARAAERYGSEDLAFAATSLARLPSPTLTDEENRQKRHRDKAAIERLLARLIAEEPALAQAIDEELQVLSSDTQALHSLLEQQNYRLAYWKSARHDLDYRRFFDINELAALRAEHDAVFEATHRLVIDWVQKGLVDGLRIDHVDGLRDPQAYFHRLRREAPKSWIVAEKILEPGEEIPDTWPIDGTTGYDFLGMVGAVFVDARAEAPFTEFYQELTGETASFEELAHQKKRMVLSDLLASDVTRLTEILAHACEAHLDYRDFTRAELRAALEEFLVYMPIYRTYVIAGQPATERDRDILESAVARAKAARSDLDGRLFEFLLQLLIGQHEGSVEAAFVSRVQQLSGPAMAKGLEDTAFYCFHRLVSLNEVGASPGQFGIEVDDFHRHCLGIQERWPRTMVTTSTHDTKRSEDVRARIALLSESPAQWFAAVRAWIAHNERHRDESGWPDRPTEYLLYQTLVGAWPISEERLLGYMEKAVREAKVHTSWTRQNQDYERALQGFCQRVIRDAEFIGKLESFLAPLLPVARLHALSQVLLKLCAPGVPDIYQGNELWDYSLTDPDNRRPVDFDLRQVLLGELRELKGDDVMAHREAGMAKMWLTWQALRLRAERPEVFGPGGSYRPLSAIGPASDRVVSFARADQVIVVAPRLTLGLTSWHGTHIDLPTGSWRNVLADHSCLTGELSLNALFAAFPVGLLARDDQ